MTTPLRRAALALLVLAGCVATGPTAGRGQGGGDHAGAVLAVIGDFGAASEHEAQVAAEVKRWGPTAVLTVGDNLYEEGKGSYDESVGRFYADFIGGYHGAHGPGSAQNHFWPSLGNHDWFEAKEGLQAYLSYFPLPRTPAQGRYYDAPADAQGLVHLYVLDSDAREPDGVTVDSKQAQWLKAALAANAATACFHVVVFHHPPYTSQTHHEASKDLRWPFKAWGIDLVLTGHNHHYERLEADGLTYVVSGNGGKDHDTLQDRPRAAESRFLDDTHFGALRLTVTPGRLVGEEVAVGVSAPVDTFEVQKACPAR